MAPRLTSAQPPGHSASPGARPRAQATEEELYSLFAPIGEILELYILRNSNGKSRGCAFVTYANKFLAQQAITQLNGKQARPRRAPPASPTRAPRPRPPCAASAAERPARRGLRAAAPACRRPAWSLQPVSASSVRRRSETHWPNPNPAQVPPGKTLVVKFADRAIASKAAATAATGYSGGPANGSFYM